MRRNVVVTGGTRGIGLAIAQALVDKGFHVIVVARTPIATVMDPDRWTFIPWDLAQVDSLGNLASVVRHHGSIYGLVNNAGISTSGILATMPDSQIARVIQLNVTAPIMLTKYLIRSMMTLRAGRVVNISSIVASTGYRGLAAYSASKAALLGFTRSLAREVGPVGITVNAIAPGFIATELTHGLTDKHRERISKRSALQRSATVDDVAAAVTFLMSDSAANITGTVMSLDMAGVSGKLPARFKPKDAVLHLLESI